MTKRSKPPRKLSESGNTSTNKRAETITKQCSEDHDSSTLKEVNNTTESRIPATEVDYLTVLLHTERERSIELRGQLSQREQVLIGAQRSLFEAQAENSVLRQKILQLEMSRESVENEKLLKERGLELGRSIRKDEETGEVYWLDPEKPKQK